MTSSSARRGGVSVLAAAIGAILLAAGPVKAEVPTAFPVLSTVSGTYLAARHAINARDYARAADLLGAALAGDPASGNLLRGTFSMAITAGQLDVALDLAGRIYAEDPDDDLALSVMLLDDVRAGRYDATLEKLEKIRTAGLSRFIVPVIRAWAEIGAGDREGAMAALDALSAEPGFQPMRDLHEALILDFAGDKAGAEAAYRRSLAASGTSRAVELAGAFFERNDATEQARTLYTQFVTAHSSDIPVAAALARLSRGEAAPAALDPAQGIAQALFQIASLVSQQGIADVALVYGRFVPFLDPNFAQGQILVAGLLGEAGQPEAALPLYQAIAAGSSPFAWGARLDAASALNKMGRRDDAIAMLTAMAAERPERSDALMQMGDLYRTSSDFVPAIAAYDAAAARAGAGAGWLLFYKRSMALQGLGQDGRAIQDLEQAISLNPDQATLLNSLGYIWIDQGTNIDRALEMVQRADRLRPNDGTIIDSLGWAAFQLGRYEDSVDALERAVELKPEDKIINEHLGDAYWMVGRRLEASFQWRRALRNAEEAVAARLNAKLEHGLPHAPTQTASTSAALEPALQPAAPVTLAE